MTELAGRTLGRYRLDSPLGQGGMAEVWRATDTKLARPVAVKVIHATFANDPHFLERFLREARVVASLEHPNVLPIYDFGEENGVPFLVMPYLAGGTLRDRLRAGPVPLPLAGSWIRQLADALDAAHAALVLHRDVKPANVLLGKDDRLFLADFGIAKMVETMSGLTATGVVVGTPTYMAPEQAKGEPASPATDRYALAVVAYEILAGRPPFEGENPLSLMHQHVTTPPPALSSRVRGLPEGLDAVFAQSLSKDPAERPPSCRALAEAVSAFLPTGMTPPTGLPTGAAAGATAPTVLQPRGATPPPPSVAPGTVPWSPPSPPAGSRAVPVATPPPPSLTSEATVLTKGRKRSRAFLFVAVAAVVIGAVGFLLKVKRGTGGENAAVPPRATASADATPPAAAAAAPITLVEIPSPVSPPLSEEKRMADLERRVKEAESEAKEARAEAARAASIPTPAPPPALPPPPAPREEGTGGMKVHAGIVAIKERLDVTKKPDRRLGREDFQFALETGKRIAAEHPNSPEVRSLLTYAEGGLAYTAGKDAVASALAVETVMVLRRAGKPDHRALAHLVTRPDGTIVPPTGWELAVAYGDARGEAMGLLEAEIREHPRDMRARKARAMLRRLRGLEPEAGDPAMQKRPG